MALNLTNKMKPSDAETTLDGLVREGLGKEMQRMRSSKERVFRAGNTTQNSPREKHTWQVFEEQRKGLAWEGLPNQQCL